MTEINRDVTFDANDNEIIAGSPVICIDDSLGGDHDTLSDWDFVKGQKYLVERVFDSENLINPMLVIRGSKNGPVMAERFVVVKKSANVISTNSQDDACKAILNAIRHFSPQAVCDLKNSLIDHEVSIPNEKNSIDNYLYADIKSWAADIDLSITESNDISTHKFSHWLNNTPSDVSFETEKEALVAAFTLFVKQQ